jgi:hypothetical protein
VHHHHHDQSHQEERHNDHHLGDRHEPPPAGTGHNDPFSRRTAVQWQTPHRSNSEQNPITEADLDKVEAAFVESFFAASDQASFLRLARIPFLFQLADGGHLHLLRVEIDALTDVGCLTPHLGGETFRYDALPRELISQRRRLRFIYFDGKGLRSLTFAHARNFESIGGQA